MLSQEGWRWVEGLVILLFLSSFPSVQAQTVRYVHTDALGSVVLVTDTNRNVIERNEYEPYGRTLSQPVSDGPAYAGHVQDAATGLTYMQQRYYDPQIGRFLSIDPVSAYEDPKSNFNRYQYASNNPFSRIDPDGRDDSPYSIAMSASRNRELERRDPAAARKAQKQGYMFWGAIMGPAVAWELAWAAFYNPLTATNVVNLGLETAAGTSIAMGPGRRLFSNLAPADEIVPAVRFAATQIQKVAYSGRLNYVVTESGELVLGRTGHTSLSRGADVMAAGEARFVNGALNSINNASGHYRPSGKEASEAAEAAFNQAGFDATGRYRELIH